MRVIAHVLQDPTDIVLSGYQPMGDMYSPFADLQPWSPMNVIQGEQPIANMFGDAVPRAMIGWNPYTPWPENIGPMAIQGGTVMMVPIGPAKPPANPDIDPIEKWLYQRVPFDNTGTLLNDGVMLPSQKEPVLDYVLTAVPIQDPTPLQNPRQEVKDSGLLKSITTSNLPDNFGLKIYENQFSSTVFTLTGTTVDGTGTPIANCRVIAYQSGWQYVGIAPVIIAQTISDGSGAFSLLLRNIDYQLTAYKEGSPDLAGITRQDVTPVVARTIYLRDPTTASSGGGGTRVYGIIG
jgi:hypothetical protein